jgi:hypothetical protein
LRQIDEKGESRVGDVFENTWPFVLVWICLYAVWVNGSLRWDHNFVKVVKYCTEKFRLVNYSLFFSF